MKTFAANIITSLVSIYLVLIWYNGSFIDYLVSRYRGKSTLDPTLQQQQQQDQHQLKPSSYWNVLRVTLGYVLCLVGIYIIPFLSLWALIGWHIDHDLRYQLSTVTPFLSPIYTYVLGRYERATQKSGRWWLFSQSIHPSTLSMNQRVYLLTADYSHMIILVYLLLVDIIPGCCMYILFWRRTSSQFCIRNTFPCIIYSICGCSLLLLPPSWQE